MDLELPSPGSLRRAPRRHISHRGKRRTGQGLADRGRREHPRSKRCPSSAAPWLGWQGALGKTPCLNCGSQTRALQLGLSGFQRPRPA